MILNRKNKKYFLNTFDQIKRILHVEIQCFTKTYFKNVFMSVKYDDRIYLMSILLLLEIDENKIFVFSL